MDQHGEQSVNRRFVLTTGPLQKETQPVSSFEQIGFLKFDPEAPIKGLNTSGVANCTAIAGYYRQPDLGDFGFLAHLLPGKSVSEALSKLDLKNVERVIYEIIPGPQAVTDRAAATINETKDFFSNLKINTNEIPPENQRHIATGSKKPSPSLTVVLKMEQQPDGKYLPMLSIVDDPPY
jgi:hypothetical protein